MIKLYIKFVDGESVEIVRDSLSHFCLHTSNLTIKGIGRWDTPDIYPKETIKEMTFKIN